MRIATLAILAALTVFIAAAPSALQAQARGGDAAQLMGIWRGSSTCTDRVALPGCTDEIAVYEFVPGPRPGTVHWLADKLVNGQRANMGEVDMTYDAAEACWKVEMSSARGKSIWCLAVDGTRMTGSARALPGNETFRKIDLRKDQSPPRGGDGPAFDVVSIKRNDGGGGPGNNPPPVFRPDGGFTQKNTPVRALIARAYSGQEIVGLPDWATSEHYDFAATSTLTTATNDERIAMLRAMLADRFQLKVHIEQREQLVYDLVLARRDGQLGQGLKKSDVDCSLPSPQPTTRERPDLTKPPPPCTVRMIDQSVRKERGEKNPPPGNLMEGTTSMDGLAAALRPGAGRVVVNKTGLTGGYTIAMTFNMMATYRPPNVDPPADAAASVFTAVQEQLGLKLEPAKASRDALVIDRLERPTPN